jgi:hypothetical protein
MDNQNQDQQDQQDQQEQKRVSIMIWVTPEERRQIRVKAAKAGLYIKDYILLKTLYSFEE